MRAFYRSSAPVEGVNDVSTNTGQPVLAEDLQKLGLQLSHVGIGSQGLARAKIIAQQSGSLTPDGIKLDGGSMGEDRCKAFLELVEAAVSQRVVLTNHVQFLVESASENLYLDIQDPIKNKWIRIEFCAGDFLDLPAGLPLQVGFNPQILQSFCIMLFTKTPGADLDHFITGKHIVLGKSPEAEKHRAVYHKALGI
ncbi:hypothetical protein E1B28_007123 [Marasmius oreades]|uniref:Uncharacterized protein n=1 Tax=Marasmius oreades TaxID=181124 RepID=A0A9P7S1Q0_9AGAR|nr:uncharacterized protein E1B28_007123 [Marasmius oreades]KAG7093445.1 hypothetical protein E1B28_007123 [Marasmius oreades]